jgi:hypothetical protein
MFDFKILHQKYMKHWNGLAMLDSGQVRRKL